MAIGSVVAAITKGASSLIAIAVSIGIPTTMIVLMVRSGNIGGAALCFLALIWLGLVAAGVASNVSSPSHMSDRRASQIRPVDATSLEKSETLQRHFDRMCPCHVWGENDVEEGNPQDEPEDCCVVCLESLAAGEECRKLACGHVFHRKCIDDWWMSKSARRLSCPLCRQKTGPTHERPRSSAVADISEVDELTDLEELV